ncbi:hypothetical protein HMPREF9123_1654 [Neisseria bacilliformis ATCC BAA-1200]|uniref:Uncharacterized protein n=1 Tax=Neisseria bacilliformis ATCC BAA-1200 TaxID=888742 RepID=F2BD48_9NEIS|nr:hypothetical protein [Neisseria bacilliformis]EGF10772.1 hypothetical protein HMPREF9123_1654 [Neisseria bacilliformis ATCC BAA-1200]QMT48596.1 hypothetical protein H3L91_05750 [Neisseria bacilliformis]
MAAVAKSGKITRIRAVWKDGAAFSECEASRLGTALSRGKRPSENKRYVYSIYCAFM